MIAGSMDAACSCPITAGRCGRLRRPLLRRSAAAHRETSSGLIGADSSCVASSLSRENSGIIEFPTSMYW